MFRRTSKTDTAPAADPAPADQAASSQGASVGKGRPTPSRREAEAAARQRARSTMDKKTAQKVLREKRQASNAKVREAMRTGDERYLPARDKGPVKRFIRNYVDARLSVAEFLLPVLVVLIVLNYSRSASAVALASNIFSALILVIVLDTGWLIFRLRSRLRTEFPDESTRGTTLYAVLRAMQMRFLRQPKPQVKLGGAPR